MADPKPYLSKTRYIKGLQCPKLIWMVFNRPEEIPDYNDSIQASFETGYEIGDLAKTLFPGGIEIEWGDDYSGAMERSSALLVERKPLFEAGFRFNGLYARADVLKPVRGTNAYDLIEVKSSTGVKDVHLEDVAFQRIVLEDAGVPLRKCFVMHVDNTYERCGDVEPRRLFAKVDVTRETAEIMPSIPVRVDAIRKAIRAKACPAVEPGEQCGNPYECPLAGVCKSPVAPQHVSRLRKGGWRIDDLIEQGIEHLGAVPDDYPLTEIQGIQVEAAKSGIPVVDRERIREFLDELKYPLHLLDFETTVNCAVPIYDFSRPYESVPFQYSLHIIRVPGAEPEHHEFLAEGPADPRPQILCRLKRLLGTRGTILAWNMPFDRRCLSDCIDRFPEHNRWIERALPRFVDLISPFRSFHYYHPDQDGSCSIKSVLPALTGKSYDDLEIGDGGTAGGAFLDTLFGKMTGEEIAATRTALLEYCKLDTQAMVDILRELEVLSCG